MNKKYQADTNPKIRRYDQFTAKQAITPAPMPAPKPITPTPAQAPIVVKPAVKATPAAAVVTPPKTPIKQPALLRHKFGPQEPSWLDRFWNWLN